MTTLSGSTSSAAVADLNLDGSLDLVAVGSDSFNGFTYAWVLNGIGNGAFGPLPIGYLAGASPYAVVVGDFNLDGKPDIATGSYTLNDLPAEISVLLNVTPVPAPTPTPTPAPAPTPVPVVVISQVYGGGGTPNARFQNSFVELMNRGGNTIDVGGWGIRVKDSSSGPQPSFSLPNTPLPLQPGQHFLIKLGPPSSNGIPILVPADLEEPQVILGLSGEIALTKPGATLSGSCPLPNNDIVDFVGIGGSACFEGGGPAPIMFNTTGVMRDSGGCKDTNSNVADLANFLPFPHNLSSDRNPCTNRFFMPSVLNPVEAEGTVSISVSRAGDLSTAATVDLSTRDGTATQLADYELLTITLRFAPGESIKRIPLLIVDDANVEGAEALILTLSNPTNGIVDIPNSSLLVIGDNDSDFGGPASNPLDQARFFVQQHYYDFLSRFPDQSGWDFWTNQIAQCGNDATCIRSKRIDVSNAFYYELEFQQTGSYVYRLYRAAFGNNQPFPNPIPDPLHPGEEKKVPAYLQFMQDRAGVSGGPQLPQSQLDLANAFVQRPAFIVKHPASLDGPAFVDAVLANIANDLGADLTGQRPALINLFNSGGRGAVMYRLADDNAQTNPINNRAFIDAEYNRAFVATQYFGYLRRDPDMAGFLFWLGQVNNAALRDVSKQHAMVCSFITSGEYQLRFSLAATHTNAECGGP